MARFLSSTEWQTAGHLTYDNEGATMHRRVLRWEVPVDDRTHMIGAGDVLHVAMRPARVQGLSRSVEVWTLETLPDDWPDVDAHQPRRAVRVFGTGQPLPGRVHHIGSTVDVDPALVWHVFEVDA